jgi:hypothetical protein
LMGGAWPGRSIAPSLRAAAVAKNAAGVPRVMP